MNDGQLDTYFDDLKQFITAVVSQSEARLEARLEEKLDGRIGSLEMKLSNRIDRLEQKMDEGFAGIAEIFEIQNDRLDNHEKRLVMLEHPVA